MANTSLLTYPKPDAPTNIMTDASNNTVGAVLQQLVENAWRPITFFSKTLNLEKLGTALLTVNYLAIKHFHYFIEGRQFHVLTDHKPLIFALQSHFDKYIDDCN